MSKTLRTVLAVICILLIAFCAALIVQKLAGRARVDLTQHRLYTLSRGTHNILGQLNTPVHLTLYYSRVAAMKGPEELRFYNNYYLYVRDLIEEYVRLSDGKLRLTITDPRRFSDEEDAALQCGIKRFPLSEDESFFFGLVAATEFGKEKVIPFFEPDRQEFVEYDISKLIVSVTRPEKKKLGILSSLDVMGSDLSPYMMQMMQMQGRQPARPWAIASNLGDEYETVRVAADADKIEPDIAYLMIVHPKDLPPKTLFAIDQFVMRGGRLLVFIDPFCYNDRPQQDPSNPMAAMGQKQSSDLNALLKNWGVEMDPEVIAVDPALAQKTMNRWTQRPAVNLPLIQLDASCVNAKEVITARLHTIRMLAAGVLRSTSPAFTPLLTTTPSGAQWKPENPFEMYRQIEAPDTESIQKSLSVNREPLVLAGRLTGRLKTNFPDGSPDKPKPAEASETKPADAASTPTDSASDAAKPAAAKPADAKPGPAKTDAPKPPDVIKESPADAIVVVVADVDMISDILAYQESFFGTAQMGDNASVVLNALDFLGGAGDLIAIRSRGRFSRPFTVVDRIERDAEKATADEVKAINEKIRKYEEDLNKLGAGAKEENVKLIASAALAERAKIQEEIRVARKELRRLNAGKREKIERLAARLETHNMVWAPAVVLLIAIAIAVIRAIQARHYAAGRNQE